MEKILGIDLGTNSIGWAIREINNSLANQIIDKGVLIFDKGVAEDKNGEHPKVQKRTESRGKRRNYQAEKYRKWALLECLIKNEMCPLTIEQLDDWRHYKKGIGRKYPQSEKFIQWLRFDFDGDGKPDFERLGYSKHDSYYLFKTLIVDENKKDIFKKEPQIIGRVLYQLVQRRGFNDCDEMDENEKNELSKTIMNGGGDSGALGANEIEPYIEKYKTLGAALYQIQKDHNVRIRKRYNLRSRYEDELKEICRVQEIENLYKLLWSAIIWQRPLRSQKGLVGICTFESNKRRCPISHPLYEEYRTWVFINNLKIDYIDKVVGNSENSTKELNAIIKKEVYPEFFKAAESFKLVVLKKKLNKLGLDITARFPDDTKVVTVSFLYRMKEIFGNDWSDMLGWQDIQLNNPKKAKYNIDDLWHLHFAKTTNKATGESPFDFLKRFALEKLNLENSKAEVYAKIRLQQGYATLSLNAITKILPYLQRGFLYSEAVYLANIAKVLGVSNVSEEVVTHFAEEMRKIMKERFIQKNYLQAINELISDQLFAENRFGMYPSYKLDDADRKEIEGKLVAAFGKTTWEAMDELEKKNANNYVSTKYEEFLQKRIYAKDVFEKTERLHDIIFAWLKNTYNVPQNNIKYLWHPSEQETYRKAPEKDDIKYLGSPEPISKGFKNPMALKTLLRLKKLINYLIETRKIDENTRIVVEIARELNDANKRKAIERWQREREKENIVFKKKIEDINKECNAKFDGNDKNLIDKVRLWEEQKRICLYTGRTIDLCDLFNGSKYDIEHTVPASMSFDNEMKNLTLADKLYNQQIKGKQLPSECPNYATEQTFNGVRYSPIVETLQLVFGQLVEVEKKIKGKRTIIKQFQKIIDLEKEYQEWMDKTSDVKEIKDNIIIKRHYLKMDLDYWRYKLSTFTITEYKAGWRNSQLRDTQIITKYALPYLKTAFKKVDVQKGSITAYFRKIYKIQPRLDKKERTKHSHHAVDAAVLTLIPPSAIRDKIILKYNEAIENNKQYHEKPLNWDNFVTDDVLRIEREVMINYLPDHRTLVSTYKNVRKRGKIQFVKEKLENSRWQYKLDRDGNKIPLVAQGDSVRGQLHQETIFGAILKPKFDQNEKAINVKGEFLHDEKVSFVKRVHLAISAVNGFKYDKKEKDLTKFLKQFEDIIDPQVRNIVLTNINERLNNNCSPESVLIEPIYMLDKNGRNVNQIRRVRVFQGNINPPEIKKIGGSEGVYLSKHKHKQFAYAENTDYVSIACYKAITDGNKEKFHFKPFTALNFAKEKSFPTHEIQEGIEFSLFWELKPGRKVVLLKTKGEKLSELSKDAIRKRVYIVNNVYPAYVKKYEYFYANLNYHLVVVSSSIKLPQMGKSVNFDNPLEAPLVRLNLDPLKSYFAIEGIHFEIMLDGEIIVK